MNGCTRCQELEAELAKVRAFLLYFGDKYANQSAVLAKLAERMGIEQRRQMLEQWAKNFEAMPCP